MGKAKVAGTAGFTAADIRNLAGLSYRQLNDWEARGALPGHRNTKRGWRRFTATEAFAIAVCSQMRTSFGVPVESLGALCELMLRGEKDFLTRAAEMIARARAPVYLVTDLTSSIDMAPVTELRAAVEHVARYRDALRDCVLVQLDELVERVLLATQDMSESTDPGLPTGAAPRPSGTKVRQDHTADGPTKPVR